MFRLEIDVEIESAFGKEKVATTRILPFSDVDFCSKFIHQKKTSHFDLKSTINIQKTICDRKKKCKFIF